MLVTVDDIVEKEAIIIKKNNTMPITHFQASKVKKYCHYNLSKKRLDNEVPNLFPILLLSFAFSNLSVKILTSNKL